MSNNSHPLYPALPAFDDAPLQRLVKGMAWVACALLGFGVIHHTIYDNTLLALVCLFALFPTVFLAFPSCPLPSDKRALVLSATLVGVVGALLIVKGDGAQGNSVLALPAILLIASLTVSRLHYGILVVATLAILLTIGIATAGHGSASIPWFNLVNTLVILGACAIVARMVASTLLKTLHRLHWETLIDAQTGLPNRLALERVAANYLVQRKGLACSVVALSIRRLDNLDSTFGHAFGDQVLRHAAKIIGNHMAADCVTGRWGENTFLFLVHHPASSAQPAALASEVQKALRKRQLINGVDIILDACCGICTEASGELPPTERIERALIAIDEAQRLGDDAIVEYSERLSQRIAREFCYEDALRRAIESDQVSMAYQPIFTADSQQIIAFEALLRLTGDDAQPIPAFDAIQLAETSGLIHRLGRTILRAVFSDIRSWRESGAPSLPVSVNFSALQLADPGIAEIVSACLREHRLGPEAIIVEVTESAAASHDASLANSLASLGNANVPLAIDDFGAGYSSLTRLLDVPAELIKFDSSLIHSADRSSEANEFLRRTVHLAHCTNARVLIEGVETRSQADIVGKLGCYAVQGYWYAHPMPADAVPGYLATREISTFRPLRPNARP